jgi:hypothetical protein
MESKYRSICVRIAVCVLAFAGWLPSVDAQYCVAVNDAAITEPLQNDGDDVRFYHSISSPDIQIVIQK